MVSGGRLLRCFQYRWSHLYHSSLDVVAGWDSPSRLRHNYLRNLVKDRGANPMVPQRGDVTFSSDVLAKHVQALEGSCDRFTGFNRGASCSRLQIRRDLLTPDVASRSSISPEFVFMAGRDVRDLCLDLLVL